MDAASRSWARCCFRWLFLRANVDVSAQFPVCVGKDGRRRGTHLSAMTTSCFLSAWETCLMKIGAGFFAVMSSLWTCANPKRCCSPTATDVLPASARERRIQKESVGVSLRVSGTARGAKVTVNVSPA